MLMGRYNAIERSSTVDGPGLRYVLFLQGCPVKCTYCYNPETWDFKGGVESSVDEIIKDFKKNPFYKNVGFTVSGGEALCQLDFVIELFKKLKLEKIHTCIETSGCVYSQNKKDLYLQLLANTDLVILDVKSAFSGTFNKISLLKNNGTFAFLDLLKELNVETIIHHVVVEGLTLKEDEIKGMARKLREYPNVKKVELLPYRSGGVYKYKNLGINYSLNDVKDLSYKNLNQAKRWLEEGLFDR